MILESLPDNHHLLALELALAIAAVKLAEAWVRKWSQRRANGNDPTNRIVRCLEQTTEFQRQIAETMSRLDQKLGSLPTHMELSRSAHDRIEAKLDGIERDVLMSAAGKTK